MIDRFRIQHDLISLDESGVVNADIAYVDTLTGDKIVEGKIDIEANKYGELETSPLDIVNQAPEFFEEIAKHNGHYDNDIYKQYTINSQAQRLAENLNDEIGDFIQERRLELGLENVVGIEDLEIEPIHGEIEEIEKGKEFTLTQSFHIISGENDINLAFYKEYQFSIDEDGDPSRLRDVEFSEINQETKNLLESEFGENIIEDLVSNIDDTAYVITNNILDNLYEGYTEAQKEEKKQKKSKGFGMSM